MLVAKNVYEKLLDHLKEKLRVLCHGLKPECSVAEQVTLILQLFCSVCKLLPTSLNSFYFAAETSE